LAAERKLRAVGALAAALLATFVWASAGYAATTRVTPASGGASARPTVVGTGFRAHRLVHVRLANLALGSVRADAQGRFTFRFHVGHRLGPGSKRLVASDGRRAVANRFTVAGSGGAASSMTADSAGQRLLLSPLAGHPGATVTITGWGFPRNASVAILFDGVQQGSARAVDGHGRVQASFKVPDVDPGAATVSVQSSRPTLAAPFRVRATPPPPGSGCNKSGPAPGASASADQVHLAWTGDPANSLTVVWHTDQAVASDVEYRKRGTSQWATASGAVRPSGTHGSLHQATLHSLGAESTYEYRVQADGGGWSQVFETCTAPGKNGTIDFVFFADTGIIGRTDGLATGTKQVRDQIAKIDPLFVLGGGDYAYFDNDKRFGSLENTIDAWFNQEQPIAAEAPLMPAYGNHEVLLGEGFTNWEQRFATPAGHTGPDGPNEDYSFDVGDAHFTSITAVFDRSGLDQATLDWIDQDLADAKARGQRWLIPYMHVPSFSDGTNHGQNVVLRGQLAPIFERYGVHLVIAAHTQNYERSYPLKDVTSASYTLTSHDPSCYTTQDGTVWMKVSPGGKLSNINGSFADFKHTPPPTWTAARDNKHHEYAHFTLSPSGIGVTAFGVKGDGSTPVVIDRFHITTGSC
jgi:hypothetical protein